MRCRAGLSMGMEIGEVIALVEGGRERRRGGFGSPRRD